MRHQSEDALKRFLELISILQEAVNLPNSGEESPGEHAAHLTLGLCLQEAVDLQHSGGQSPGDQMAYLTLGFCLQKSY